MLPSNNLIINNEEIMTSKTYNLNIYSNHVAGKIDGREALTQAIYLMLSTERYEAPIYNQSYGVELDSLIGHQQEYVQSEIKRIIKDCLIQDDRIVDVINFKIEFKEDRAIVQFLVESNIGDVDLQWEVKI